MAKVIAAGTTVNTTWRDDDPHGRPARGAGHGRRRPPRPRRPARARPRWRRVPEATNHGAAAARTHRSRRPRTTPPRRRAGDPSSPGVDAELLAGVGLEGELGIAHHRLGQRRASGGVEPPRLVDAGQLGRLEVGLPAQLAALDLAARARAARPGRASSCTRRPPSRSAPDDEPGQARPGARRAGAGIGAGHAEDQAHVGHQPVADAEHRGPGRAALDVAVVVLGVDGRDVAGSRARRYRRRRAGRVFRRAARTLAGRAHPLRPRPRRARRAAGRRAALPRRPGVGRPVPPARRARRADDLPKALRARLDDELPRRRSTPVAESADDGGDTVKWLCGLDGGARVETVLMHYPDRTTVCVSSQAGCAMGVRVLRHRAGRLRAPPHDRRDRRAGGARRPAGPATPAAGSQRRVHGHGRAARQLRPACGRRSSGSTATWACRPATSRSRRSASSRASAGSPSEDAAGEPGRLAPRRQRRRCATSSCRSTGATRWRCSWTPAPTTSGQGPPAVVRVGADRRHERPRPRRPRAGRAVPGLPLPAHVNLIPLNPTPGYPTRGTPPRRRAPLPRPARRPRRERHRAPQPGHRHRRRLRPARRPGRAAGADARARVSAPGR